VATVEGMKGFSTRSPKRESINAEQREAFNRFLSTNIGLIIVLDI